MNPPDRFRLWLNKHPGAVSGQSGHATTFAVCCRAVEFGLSFDEAMPLLLKWNERCQPPWTPAALRHKLTSAFNRTHPKPHFTDSKTSARTVTRNFPAAKTAVAIPAAPLDFRAFGLTAGTVSQVLALAASRRLSIAGIKLAIDRALLRFGWYRERPAWFILDTLRRFAVVRRLDGECWFGDTKAWAIRSGPAANGEGVWPVGVIESQNYPKIALVEGGPDLLAAFHFIEREGRQDDCTAVMMFSSSPQIHPAALPYFAGKRVRIFTHADDNGAGDKAAARWTAQLESVGAIVGCRRCSSAMGKDLNDLARLPDFNEPILP